MKTNLQLTFLLLLFNFLGYSQAGQIDATFNSSGTGLGTSGNRNVYKARVYSPADPINKDKVVIGGRFRTYNGFPRHYVARLNPDGSLDTSFVGPDIPAGYYVYCVEILPTGKIMIGGDFVTNSSPAYTNLARLNEDGSLDMTFNASAIGDRGPNAAGLVHAILVQPNNKILVGGSFASYNGIARKNLTRLNADGSLDATFNSIGSIDAEIRALASQGDKIIVGGFFTKWQGTTSPATPTYERRMIMRLNSDGTFDNTFNTGGVGAKQAVSGWGGTGIFDFVVMPDGPEPMANMIYAVGKFDSYNNVACSKSIVRLTKDGVLDATFNAAAPVASRGVTSPEVDNPAPGSGKNVFSIKLQPDGKILIGGNMTEFNGIVIPKGIARLNSNGSLDPTFLTGAGFIGGTGVFQGKSVLRDIVLQSDGKIIVGGDFTSYDANARNMIARIKTRECPNTAIYVNNTIGWKDGILPTNDTFYTVISAQTLTIPTGTHLVACELEISKNARIQIEPNASLTVKGVVMNNGSFVINSGGSLVQVQDDAVNADLGAGTFTMQRRTTPVKRYDYTYWSSPVERQDLYTFSPNTLSDKYFKWNPTGNSWTLINFGAEIMKVGQGYIVRAPQTVSTSAAQQVLLQFTGRPNNGLVEADIESAGTSNLNLIGNPYPSAINALSFLNNPANTSVVGGTIYLWTHKTEVNPIVGIVNYSSDDYVIYNKMGTTVHSPTGVPFNGNIAAGQSFFINGLVPLGKATFNNGMRVAGNDTNTQFYRMTNQSNSNTRAEVQQPIASFERSRLWLNLTNAQGAFKQTLVGYATGATDGFDRDYDGANLNGNSFVNLYTISEGKNYAIQGRALPLNDTKTVKVGYSVSIAGSFTITLPEFDGLFENYNIYLFDNLLNTRQNLRDGSYTFTTAIGTFNERFELHFKERSNGLDKISTEELVSEKDIAVIKHNDEVSIKSSILINDVTVYDLSGKMIFSQNDVNAVEFNTGSLNIQSSVVIVKMKLNNGQEVSKKIIVD